MGVRHRRPRLRRRTHATRLCHRRPHQLEEQHQHQLQHQHPRQDAMTNRLIGRAQLEARALTMYQRRGALLTAAMAVVGTKARMDPLTIGLSTEWRPPLLVVVVVAAPQCLADRRVRDTLMTRRLAKQWDAAGGTFSSAAEQMMRMHNATQAILVTPTMVETAVPMMQPMQMGAPAVSAMPMMESAMATPAAAMQGIGGFGTQAVSAMPVGGSAFGTQSMPTVPYLM